MEKTFEMLINDEMVDGVFAISLVDSPAIQTDYILLSKDSNKISIELKLEKLADAKRHIVCGPALVPGIIIPRNGFNITFSAETIRKISENFLMNGYKDNVTLQHQANVNKVYLVESWIIENPETDKAKTLGYDLPAGTWMTSFKITDENLWTEYIASGVLKGFSIEGNFSQKEVQLQEIDEDDVEVMKLYLAITYPAKEQESYYKWEVSKGENCPSCKAFDGQIHKLKDWIYKAIPAVPDGSMVAGLSTSYPYSPFGTYCEDNCKCKLVKVQSPDFIKKSIVRPW